MKKLLKLVMIVLLCAPTAVWAMNKKEPLPEKQQKQFTHYFIQFQNKELPVSFEVLNQFEVYKVQSKNIEKFGDKETIRVLKKSVRKFCAYVDRPSRP